MTTTTMQIDFYSSATASTATATTTLSDLIDAIRSDEYANKIARLRSTLAAGDDDGYAVAKKDLQAVSISGTADGKRAKAIEEGRFSHSGLLQLDFDAADNVGWTVEEIVEILQAEPRIVAAFVSPSGHGVKGIARIPVCQTKEEHVAAFAAARNHFRAHNLTIDEACKDPVRLMFVSHDPGAWLDLERTAVFEPDKISDTKPAKKPAIDRTAGFNTDKKTDKKPGIKIKAPRTAFPEPPREGIHAWLMQAAWHCRFAGMSEADTAIKLQGYEGSLRRQYQPNEVRDAVRTVYDSPMPEPTADWREAADMDAAKAASGSTMQSFNPADIFYDAPANKYLVKVGSAYMTYSKLSPIITGVTRHLADDYDEPKDLARAVRDVCKARELDGGVQWHGSIAGHAQGLAVDSNDLPILITSEAKTPRPSPGDAPIISEIVGGAFADPTATMVFMSWLAGRYKAVRSHVHIPSPMLVLAGEINSGKSLIAWIVAQALGGRTANPYASWSGGMLWNDDLVSSELLLVDDCVGSTDIRSRRNFGASFKEAIYPHVIQLRKRNASSIAVRPVWACIVCCNDTPESLQIIPPLDNDLADKVALLHVIGVRLPVDTSTPEGKLELQAIIRSELPAFAQQLMDWVTPDELHDSRSGVKAWRDPLLTDAVDAHSPARRLEELLEAALTHMGLWGDLPRDLTSADIEGRLKDVHSPVFDQAKQLCSWHGAMGSALAKLARSGSEFVTLSPNTVAGKQPKYWVTPPTFKRSFE
jgi:hypothetical protein